MADTFQSFAQKVDKLERELSGDAMMTRVGLAAKKAALDAAEGDLGSDRVFSGFGRRNAKLGARYDITGVSAVNLELYPKGLWVLANDGRRKLPPGGRVYPRKRRGGSGAKALNTPYGPRRSVKASTSRGLGTLADAETNAQREAYKAADRQVKVVIRTVFR
jgi:hypothetical protein